MKPAVPYRVSNVVSGDSVDVIDRIAPWYLNGRTVVDLTPGDKLGFWRGSLELDHGVPYVDQNGGHFNGGYRVTLSTHNYHALPYRDDMWDTVVFDPAFVPYGGRNSKDPDARAMMARYGLLTVPKTVPELHADIMSGLREAVRVCKVDGFVILKAQFATVSGDMVAWPYEIWSSVAGWNVELYDMVVQERGLGMQPLTRRLKDGTVVPRDFNRTSQGCSIWSIFRKTRAPRKPIVPLPEYVKKQLPPMPVEPETPKVTDLMAALEASLKAARALHELNAERDKPLTRCMSDGDGECVHRLCPQIRDNEPATSSRACPLYDWNADV